MPWHWEYLSKKQMDWEPFKCLFWNANESTVKLIVSITSGATLWYRPIIKVFNLWQRQEMPKT